MYKLAFYTFWLVIVVSPGGRRPICHMIRASFAFMYFIWQMLMKHLEFNHEMKIKWPWKWNENDVKYNVKCFAYYSATLAKASHSGIMTHFYSLLHLYHQFVWKEPILLAMINVNAFLMSDKGHSSQWPALGGPGLSLP